MAEIWRTDEAGDKMPVVLIQKVLQSNDGLCEMFFRSQVEVQCQNMSCLSLSCHIPILIEECFLESPFNRVSKESISLRILISTKNVCHFGKEPCRVFVIRGGDQIGRRGTEITAFFSIQRHPITKLEPIAPDISFGMISHEIYPCLHAFVLDFQNLCIAMSQIQNPWIDHRSIRPCGGGMASLL